MNQQLSPQSNTAPGKLKAYASILFALIPTILFFLFVHPRTRFWMFIDTQVALSILIVASVFISITAPFFGVIGIVLSKRAKRDGYVGFAVRIGFICSIINILLTARTAFGALFSLLLFLFQYL